ncbi:glycosyltransferase [Pseudoclavibacter sp. RFBB5]|uniref:glycosyltransferase n=1 Tax=Pseudoclavibacter sp. RFBB5 TaxID=2080574 RepID=UPI0015E1F16F|nr:glycosyltransferase [Pseudoclavibacter sp. RFBB5]
MTLVIDGFIGMYETEVEDKKTVLPGSYPAKKYRFLDAVARRVADYYLIDTEVRAREIVMRTRSKVFALPVGAPDWAVQHEPANGHDEMRILYYGNYIELHGLDVLVPAVRRASESRKIRFTLIGDGPSRAAVEAMTNNWPSGSRVVFLDPVPQEKLPKYIAENDLVLGVFGSSLKSRSVIANKVWQGLSSGRVVLTQVSPAMLEIEQIAGSALVQVEASEEAIATALVGLDLLRVDRGELSAHLEDYVQMKFERFLSAIRDVSPRSHWKF